MTKVENSIPDVADKLCDICGVCGYGDRIVTCFMCNIVSEHLYCMRKQLFQCPPKWKCEFCSANPTQGLSSVKRITKPIEAGRVKIMPLDAVPGFRNKRKPPAIQEKHDIYAVDCAVPAVPFSPRTPTCSISGKKLEYGYPEVKSSANEVQSMGGKEDDLLEPLYLKTCKPNPCSFSGVASNAGLLSSMGSEGHALDVTHDDKLAMVPKRPGYCIDVESAGSQILSSVTVRIPKSKLVRGQIPKANWKGDFEMLNVAAADICDGILAFYMGQITQKAYEAAKLLPSRLGIIIVKRLDIWPKIFVVDPPDNDDIALSFLPNDNERSKSTYFRLLDRMNSHDLAMKCQLEGIELLVFSSKMLHACSQKLDGDLYLWGVFRSSKQLPGKHSESVVRPAHPPIHGKRSESEFIEETLRKEGALKRDSKRPCYSMPPDRAHVASKPDLGKRLTAVTTCNSDLVQRPRISFTLKKPQLGKSSPKYDKVVRGVSDKPAEFDISMNSRQGSGSNMPRQTVATNKIPLITESAKIIKTEWDCPPGFETCMKLGHESSSKQSGQKAVTMKGAVVCSREASLLATSRDTGGLHNSNGDNVPTQYSQDGGWRPWGCTDSIWNHNPRSEIAPSPQRHVDYSKSKLHASNHGSRPWGCSYNGKIDGTGYNDASKSKAAPRSLQNTHFNLGPAVTNQRSFKYPESPCSNIPKSYLSGKSQSAVDADDAGLTNAKLHLGSSSSVKWKNMREEH